MIKSQIIADWLCPADITNTAVSLDYQSATNGRNIDRLFERRSPETFPNVLLIATAILAIWANAFMLKAMRAIPFLIFAKFVQQFDSFTFTTGFMRNGYFWFASCPQPRLVPLIIADSTIRPSCFLPKLLERLFHPAINALSNSYSLLVYKNRITAIMATSKTPTMVILTFFASGKSAANPTSTRFLIEGFYRQQPITIATRFMCYAFISQSVDLQDRFTSWLGSLENTNSLAGRSTLYHKEL